MADDIRGCSINTVPSPLFAASDGATRPSIYLIFPKANQLVTLSSYSARRVYGVASRKTRGCNLVNGPALDQGTRTCLLTQERKDELFRRTRGGHRNRGALRNRTSTHADDIPPFRGAQGYPARPQAFAAGFESHERGRSKDPASLRHLPEVRLPLKVAMRAVPS